VFGISMHREFALLRQAGLTLEKSLRARPPVPQPRFGWQTAAESAAD
jgi:hypothetical protein